MRVAATVAALIALAGCSDTASQDRDLGINLDTGTIEDVQPDTMPDTGDDADAADVEVGGDGALPQQDTDEACTEGSCGELETCVDGSCIENDVLKCDNAIDKGTLAPGDSTTIKDTFLNYDDDVLETTCASGRGPERVYKFTVAKDSLVTADPDYPGMFQAKMEFRKGGCLESGEDDLCYDNAKQTFFAEAGTSFHLVVEQDVGRGGDFTIDLSVQAAACDPDTRSCASKEKVQICDDPTGSQPYLPYSCAAGGCAEGHCAGDACSNPIVVNGSTTISGKLEGFRPKYNFADNSLCHDRLDEPVRTTGPDVIFKLPGLEAGQTVTIDTTGDARSNAFFVTTNCSEEVAKFTCQEVRTDESDKEWNVPFAGDYYVIVDKFGVSGGSFNYKIDIK